MAQNNLTFTLDRWKYISAYSTWMYHTYEEYVGKRIFDVGAGLGRMIPYYIEQCERVVASEIFEDEVRYMNEQFAAYPNFSAIQMDISTDAYAKYTGEFDTVLCINTLEHIENDRLAVEHMLQMLRAGGRLVIFVPAMQKLYCQLDVNVHHYRRYQPGVLCKMGGDNTKILKNIHFNFFGMFPYYLKGRKKKIEQNESFGTSLNENNSKLYNVASKILEPIEKRIPPKVGLSEMIVFEKIR